MNLPRYPLTSSDKMLTFEFVSEGKKGLINKLVQFQSTNVEGIYNLAFGDKDLTSGEIDDKAISNNGDIEKILTTVASSVYVFTEKYPQAFIYATGRTKARTRLNRMGISKFWNELNADFEILGELPNGWEEFSRHVEYEGFLVRRK